MVADAFKSQAIIYCRFKVRTLEEAEQEMDGGQQARKMANSRLAALVANGKQPCIYPQQHHMPCQQADLRRWILITHN